jgi:hypothetical protein
MSLEVVSVGLLATFFAAQMGLNFGGRKNEPIIRRIVWGGIVRGRLARPVFVLVQFQNLSGLIELAQFADPALSLDFAD